MTLYVTTCPSPLGEIVLLASDTALVGTWLPGQTPDPVLMAQAHRRDSAPLLLQGRDWLQRYFCGKRPAPGEIPLDPQGSEFRQQVWQRLCRIPYGELTTYG
ncbi:MAG: methylated-DNA--[protein]-cysteine S-methyltransferase, partial [Blautia massiliensis (ex Durand et al. 2017)]